MRLDIVNNLNDPIADPLNYIERILFYHVV